MVARGWWNLARIRSACFGNDFAPTGSNGKTVAASACPGLAARVLRIPALQFGAETFNAMASSGGTVAGCADGGDGDSLSAGGLWRPGAGHGAVAGGARLQVSASR